MTRVTITRTHLEITDRAWFRPKRLMDEDLRVAKVDPPMPELNRFFYALVGEGYHWFERLTWSRRQWVDYLSPRGMETWVLTVAGIPAGYFELNAQDSKNVEIVYFGLLPRFVGRGLGSHLLTHAVERAWKVGADRVWLHTCTLDHASALEHYKSRGFREYKSETFTELVPLPAELWPGAGPVA